jgi:hypothetical protein
VDDDDPNMSTDEEDAAAANNYGVAEEPAAAAAAANADAPPPPPPPPPRRPLKHLRAVRVFLSAGDTTNSQRAEIVALRNDVFPYMTEFCRNLGLDFHVVTLDDLPAHGDVAPLLRVELVDARVVTAAEAADALARGRSRSDLAATAALSHSVSRLEISVGAPGSDPSVTGGSSSATMAAASGSAATTTTTAATTTTTSSSSSTTAAPLNPASSASTANIHHHGRDDYISDGAEMLGGDDENRPSRRKRAKGGEADADVEEVELQTIVLQAGDHSIAIPPPHVAILRTQLLTSCITESVGPAFVGLVGEATGPVIPESIIEKPVLDGARDRLRLQEPSTRTVDHSLIGSWYRLDTNPAPPVYRLVPARGDIQRLANLLVAAGVSSTEQDIPNRGGGGGSSSNLGAYGSSSNLGAYGADSPAAAAGAEKQPSASLSRSPSGLTKSKSSRLQIAVTAITIMHRMSSSSGLMLASQKLSGGTTNGQKNKGQATAPCSLNIDYYL